MALAKFPPGRAESSTGHADPAEVRSDLAPGPVLKRRFQTAYQHWRIAGGAGREAFADELQVPFSAVKRWLSESDERPVWPDAVLRAERLASSAREGDATDARIASAVREFTKMLVHLIREEAA
ncbi:MAG: hypothetical protein AAFY88_12980 [Acidobacteriota bacterium]